MRTRPAFAVFALFLGFGALLVTGFQPYPQSPDDRGKQVFDNVCSTCHSLNPPMKAAPPMLMVAQHYMDADLDDPWSAMKNWIGSPDVARSNMPAHAVDRFGLMPQLQISEEDAAAVVDYIKEEYAKRKAAQPAMAGHGEMRHGQHGQMGGGMEMHADSTAMKCGMMEGGEHSCPMHDAADSTAMGGMHGKMMEGGMMQHRMGADSTAGHRMMEGAGEGMQCERCKNMHADSTGTHGQHGMMMHRRGDSN